MHTSVRHLEGMEPRVETGPTRFGNDTVGLFIRGPACSTYAANLRRALAICPDQNAREGLTGLLDALESVRIT